MNRTGRRRGLLTSATRDVAASSRRRLRRAQAPLDPALVLQELARRGDASGVEAIRVTRRSPRSVAGLPRVLEQSLLGETHQNRVQRSRLQLGLLREVVAVTPFGRPLQQRGQNVQGLP